MINIKKYKRELILCVIDVVVTQNPENISIFYFVSYCVYLSKQSF